MRRRHDRHASERLRFGVALTDSNHNQAGDNGSRADSQARAAECNLADALDRLDGIARSLLGLLSGSRGSIGCAGCARAVVVVARSVKTRTDSRVGIPGSFAGSMPNSISAT